jgi:hypothetical protein
MLSGLLDAKEKGHQSDNGFKKAGWKIAIERVAAAGGSSDEEQIKSKYRNIREIWNKWKAFERAAGSGWNKLDDGSLINDMEVEEQFFQKYPEFKRFRRTPCPHYWILLDLFGDRLATGDHALDVNTMVALAEEDMQNDSDTAEESPPRSASITPPNQERPSPSTSATPSNSANEGKSQRQKRKRATEPSVSLRKRAALKRATAPQQKASKRPSSALRGFTTELGETNRVLKNLHENSSPISMAVTLLGKDLPKISFVNKMKVIQKLREPDMADIYTHLPLKERKLLVENMLNDLGISLDDAMEGDGSDSNGSGDSEIEIVDVEAGDD